MGLYKTPKDNPMPERSGSVKTRLLEEPASLFPQTPPAARAGELSTPSRRVRNPTRLVVSEAVAVRPPVPDTAGAPVVGWLVIVAGPGRGAFRPVGHQVNPIGRDPHAPSNRILLDFGDETISGERHAAIIFDPRTRRFYLERGDGANLCYINDRPVGRDPTEIPPHAKLSFGTTDCVLVPFCGAQFDWSDPAYPFDAGAPADRESGG